MKFNKEILKLYMITDSNYMDERESVLKAVKSGATCVQYRAKNTDTKQMIEVAKDLKKICNHHNVPLIINDRLDIALAIQADGIHIGQDDMPIEIVKKYASNMIIGVSASNIEQALIAEKKGADYIGAGAVFSTQTKKDANYMGIESLKELMKKIKIPVAAIGGINLKNIKEVLKTNIDGVCIISALLCSKDIEKTTKEFLKIIEEEHI
ncbi:thiamine-phosphate diphosphorylase [Oceanotoga teriensis]|jgi:thiamine-phosphate pyrophosphorylase|uniref:Thiamine-phosphate synthase n=1 Tax=Oceanotoga teriensis TaxID=515440 RepID=A0AA45C4E9_9BACT|nr:thiamine phosphate synthase [Oceanotoga teriensis]PWJ84365.1 thiamine-phosphate diphosphorylase [Oceanotoga teriensis]